MNSTKLKTVTIYTDFLSKCLNNPSYTDAILIVEGKEFPVSRLILSMHSTYFEGLFKSSSENEQKDKHKLDDVMLKPFEIILNYMYTGDLDLNKLTHDELMDLLNLGDYLGTRLALEKIAHYIAASGRIDDDTIVPLINAAGLYDLKQFQNDLMEYLAPEIKSFTKPEIFNTFNEDALIVILGCDELAIREIDLIWIVEKWLMVNTTTKREMILKKIRLTLMPTVQLLEEVQPKNIFPKQQLLDSILKYASHSYEKYRYDPSIKAREIKVTDKGKSGNWRTFEVRFRPHFIGRFELCTEKLDYDMFLFLSKDDFLQCDYEDFRYIFTFSPHETDRLKFKLPEFDKSYEYSDALSKNSDTNILFNQLRSSDENLISIY